MTAVEVLRAARARIEAPEKWTQGDYAKDVNGDGVDPGSDSAVCFCAIGSILATGANSDARRDAEIALERVLASTVARFNDTHSHDEVMEAFGQAIVYAERRAVAS